jgi:hypothetical protein
MSIFTKQTAVATSSAPKSQTTQPAKRASWFVDTPKAQLTGKALEAKLAEIKRNAHKPTAF